MKFPIEDILPVLPEVRDEGFGYKMFDDGGVEQEVGEFLYGMVRILKPKSILETGTYTGVSASYMGMAMKENGYGLLETVEIDNYHKNRAENLWKKLYIESYVYCWLVSSLEFDPKTTYDMFFLDSEPNLRFKELVKFYPKLKEGGYVFIHDLPRSMTQGNINPDHPEIASWPFGDLPEEIKQWEKSGELVRMHFPNPRGMVGWYKRHKDDYDINNR